MRTIILAMAVAIVVPAQPSHNAPWFSRSCELTPISLWEYRYEACDETTDYKSLNCALALKLDQSPEFERYRFYRGWENWMQAGFISGSALLLIDIVGTKAMGGLCSSSFNPSCGDVGLTTVPVQYYLAFFGISIPLNAISSYKRINYMKALVSDYNRKLDSTR